MLLFSSVESSNAQAHCSTNPLLTSAHTHTVSQRLYQYSTPNHWNIIIIPWHYEATILLKSNYHCDYFNMSKLRLCELRTVNYGELERKMCWLRLQHRLWLRRRSWIYAHEKFRIHFNFIPKTIKRERAPPTPLSHFHSISFWLLCFRGRRQQAKHYHSSMTAMLHSVYPLAAGRRLQEQVFRITISQKLF